MLFAEMDSYWSAFLLLAFIGFAIKKAYEKFDTDGAVHTAAKEGIIRQITKWLK